MPLAHKIADHLLIPFGRASAALEAIHVDTVSPDGFVLHATHPLAVIRKPDCRAVRLRDFQSVIPGPWPVIPEDPSALRFVESQLISTCDPHAPLEQWFIELYMKFCRAAISTPRSLLALPIKDRPDPYNHPRWIFDALLPLPQAHLYTALAASQRSSLERLEHSKASFAFWTGRRIIALEIDDSGSGSEEGLERAGIHVVRLRLQGLDEAAALRALALMPDELTHYWKFAESRRRLNPFDDAHPH